MMEYLACRVQFMWREKVRKRRMRRALAFFRGKEYKRLVRIVAAWHLYAVAAGDLEKLRKLRAAAAFLVNRQQTRAFRAWCFRVAQWQENRRRVRKAVGWWANRVVARCWPVWVDKCAARRRHRFLVSKVFLAVAHIRTHNSEWQQANFRLAWRYNLKYTCKWMFRVWYENCKAIRQFYRRMARRFLLASVCGKAFNGWRYGERTFTHAI